MTSHDDTYWIIHALTLAKKAEQQGEVPVGAVIVHDHQIVGEGWNQPIGAGDPTAHAEIIAMRNAAQHLKNYRLINCTLYVTLEPCAMCVGAMVHARISRLVFGAFDRKAGAVTSVMQLLDAPHFNHIVTHQGGICAEKCSEILKSFFAMKRKT